MSARHAALQDDEPTDTHGIEALISAWVPNQRWFAGKGREARITAAPLTMLDTEPVVIIWTAHVDYSDGDTETYQVPLVVYTEPIEYLEHVLLGTVELNGKPSWVYDALHDKGVTPAWLTGIRDQSEHDAVHFTRFVDSPDDIPVDQPSLVLSGEQSNTSMVFGDAAIMKVFRRLQPGVNPDIEVQGELSKLGAKHIARMLGAVAADVDGLPTSLAMLQEYLTSATDGWVLATASVRDLMAEADLHAAEAGGDFAGEAERLGAAVADVHDNLAEAFGSRETSSTELGERAAAMRAKLQRAVEIVPQLADVAEGLNDIYRQVAELPQSAVVHRIHGDLHLGQALRTVYRWVLIDFEGEPMVEIGARREFDSPLRDVAGMLRSFDYAGHHRVIESGYDSQLTYRAQEWSERNRTAFLDGYREATGRDLDANGVLLRAYEADKAVYEAVYEARNRPGWLAIPLASLTRLATTEGSSS